MELIPGKKYTCTLLKKSDRGLMVAVKLSDDSFRLIPKNSIILDYVDSRIGKRLTCFIAPKNTFPNNVYTIPKIPQVYEVRYDPFTHSNVKVLIPDFNGKLI